jgi:hypothetical protein
MALVAPLECRGGASGSAIVALLIVAASQRRPYSFSAHSISNIYARAAGAVSSTVHSTCRNPDPGRSLIAR